MALQLDALEGVKGTQVAQLLKQLLKKKILKLFCKSLSLRYMLGMNPKHIAVAEPCHEVSIVNDKTWC
jgi:hypothetical protein